MALVSRQQLSELAETRAVPLIGLGVTIALLYWARLFFITLFTAVAMARTEPWHILAPFFLGRLIPDGVLVFSGKYASANLSDLLHGQANWKSLLTLLAGLLVIGIFLFIDWRSLLAKKKLRFRFKILK